MQRTLSSLTATAALATLGGCVGYIPPPNNPPIPVPVSATPAPQSTVYGDVFGTGQVIQRDRIFPAAALGPTMAFLGACWENEVSRNGMRTDYALICGDTPAVASRLRAQGHTLSSYLESQGYPAPSPAPRGLGGDTHTVTYTDPRKQADCTFNLRTVIADRDVAVAGLPAGTVLPIGYTVLPGHVLPYGSSTLSCSQQRAVNTYRMN